MKFLYLGKMYECVRAIRSKNHIAIYTGKIEDSEEVIHHIYGDINFDAVEMVDGVWEEQPSTEDILNVLLGVES